MLIIISLWRKFPHFPSSGSELLHGKTGTYTTLYMWFLCSSWSANTRSSWMLLYYLHFHGMGRWSDHLTTTWSKERFRWPHPITELHHWVQGGRLMTWCSLNKQHGPSFLWALQASEGTSRAEAADPLVLRPWRRRNSDVWKSLSVWGWCSHNRSSIRFPERENTPSLLWSLVAACFTPLHLMLCIGLGDVRLGWSTSLSEGRMKFGGLYWKLATKYFSICVLRCRPLGGWDAVLPHRSHFVVRLHSQLTVESLVTSQNSPYCRRCIPSP